MTRIDRRLATLEFELRARGHHVEREFWTDVFNKGRPIARQRLDMIVDRAIVLEVNATERLPPFARRQLLNYSTVTKLELGLLFTRRPRTPRRRPVTLVAPIR